MAARSPRKTPTPAEEASEKPPLIKLVTKKNLSIIHESKRESKVDATNDEEVKLDDASVTKRTQTIFKKNLKLNIKEDEEDSEEHTERREQSKALSSDNIDESHHSFESSEAAEKKEANSEEMTNAIKEITNYEEPKILQSKLTKMKQMRKPTLNSVF